MTVSFHRVLLKPDRQIRRPPVGIWRHLYLRHKCKCPFRATAKTLEKLLQPPSSGAAIHAHDSRGESI
jgi:hypothetical protein